MPKTSKMKYTKLNKNKASQVSDILFKVIKDNVDIFADFICEDINRTLKSSFYQLV